MIWIFENFYMFLHYLLGCCYIWTGNHLLLSIYPFMSDGMWFHKILMTFILFYFEENLSTKLYRSRWRSVHTLTLDSHQVINVILCTFFPAFIQFLTVTFQTNSSTKINIIKKVNKLTSLLIYNPQGDPAGIYCGSCPLYLGKLPHKLAATLLITTALSNDSWYIW